MVERARREPGLADIRVSVDHHSRIAGMRATLGAYVSISSASGKLANAPSTDFFQSSAGIPGHPGAAVARGKVPKSTRAVVRSGYVAANSAAMGPPSEAP